MVEMYDCSARNVESVNENRPEMIWRPAFVNI